MIERERMVWIERKSPLGLTEQGLMMLNDSDGKHYIDTNKGDLVHEITLLHPKTAYDVQELSKKVLEQRSNDDGFIPIKNFAYKNGADLSDIINAMRLYLRDIALSKLSIDSMITCSETQPV
jgi:hypothetical protein